MRSEVGDECIGQLLLAKLNESNEAIDRQFKLDRIEAHMKVDKQESYPVLSVYDGAVLVGGKNALDVVCGHYGDLEGKGAFFCLVTRASVAVFVEWAMVDRRAQAAGGFWDEQDGIGVHRETSFRFQYGW